MRKLVFAAGVLGIVGLLTPAGWCAEGASGAPPKAAAGGAERSVFLLADGSRVTGQVSVKSVTMTTAYGRLEVPISELVRLRVARGSDEPTRKTVEGLIRDLSSTDFAKREKATEELRKLGDVAIGLLTKAAASGDAEVRSRVQKLLDDYEKDHPEAADEENLDAPLLAEDDEIVTRRFTARGRLETERFTVTTEYGQLEVPAAKVISAAFGLPETVNRIFAVTGQHFMEKPLATGVRVTAGDTLRIRSSGVIHFNNADQDCTPAGNSDHFGRTPQGFLGGAVLGRIGNGPFFLIGENAVIKVAKAGTLTLCLAFGGNPGEYTGEFTVKVAIDRGGK
jgi:hypothetical protein